MLARLQQRSGDDAGAAEDFARSTLPGQRKQIFLPRTAPAAVVSPVPVPALTDEPAVTSAALTIDRLRQQQAQAQADATVQAFTEAAAPAEVGPGGGDATRGGPAAFSRAASSSSGDSGGDDEPIELAPLVQPEEKKKSSGWGLVLAGLGTLALGGAVVWGVRKKRGHR